MPNCFLYFIENEAKKYHILEKINYFSFMADDSHTKRLFWFIFAGSRGGLNRLKIIRTLQQNPTNINQLANLLGFDYKAIRHHMTVLEKNNLVVKEGEKYAITYFISPFLEVNINSFNEISEKLDKSK